MTTLNHQTDEALDRMLAELVGWKFWQNQYETWVATAPSGLSVAVPGTIEQGINLLVNQMGLPRFTQSLDECARVVKSTGIADTIAITLYHLLIPKEDQNDDHFLTWSMVSKIANASPRDWTIALIQTLQSTP